MVQRQVEVWSVSYDNVWYREVEAGDQRTCWSPVPTVEGWIVGRVQLSERRSEIISVS